MEHLKRSLGLFSATTYILGVIIGAGIYVILGKAAGITGNSLWLSFIFAAFIAACTGMSYAELASTFPKDSAEYIYTERAFKDRRFSFGVCWLKLITLFIGTAAVALGFGGYLSRLTGLNFIVCALLLLLVVTMLNIFGIKQAMVLDSIMVVLAVIGLFVVIGFGLPHLHGFDFYLDMPNGFSGIFTAAALIFFAYLGFENVGNIGEEVKNPKKTLPYALIISIIISTILYVLVAVIAVSIVPWEQLGQSNAPLSDVMTAILGSKAGIFLAIMALGATGSTVLGLFIATSRTLYGMAEEKSMPSFFLKLTKKRKLPYIAILTTFALSAVFIIPGDIAWAAFITDFSALFVFLVVNLCVIVLRYSHDHIIRGFKVPLNIGKFPVIPALGIISCSALLFSFEKKMFFMGMALFLVGMLLYSVLIDRKRREITVPEPAIRKGRGKKIKKY